MNNSDAKGFRVVVILLLSIIVGILIASKDTGYLQEIRDNTSRKSISVHLAPVQEAVITITAYTARKQECNNDPHRTAIMSAPKVGRTVAVSYDLIHWLGGWVYISEIGIRKVEDLMNDRFVMKMDLLVGTVAEAKKWGIQERRVVFLGR